MGRIQDAVNKYEARCTTTTDQCEGLVEQVRADVWRLTSVAMLKWELMCLDGLMVISPLWLGLSMPCERRTEDLST